MVYVLLSHQHFLTSLPINFDCQMEYGPIHNTATFNPVITELVTIPALDVFGWCIVSRYEAVHCTV